VFHFEDRRDVVSIPNTFELLRNTLHMWDIQTAQRLLLFIQTTATLGINDRINETLRIAAELEITSHDADFFNQILSLLAYGGSSIVKTLGQNSLHMQRMVEVQVSASVGWFPIDFGG
jgi:hypothetical protein